MNKTHHILLTLVLLLLLPVSALALNQGDKLLPFTGQDMDGKTVDTSAYIGKQPIMLIFWASWCPNCKSEVPKVNALVKKYGSRGMKFIGINVGHNDSEGKARRFMDKTGITYPVIFDKRGKIPRKYGVQGVPTVLIADKNGNIVFRNYGVPDITDKQFQQLSQ
jgi:peroxiredoxin